MKSIHAIFEGIIPPDETIETPPGAALARHLVAQLWEAGWQSTEFKPWKKKRGWVLPVTLAEISLDLVFHTHAKIENGWELSIEPSYVPGLFAKFDGNIPSGGPADCYMLAKSVHEILAADEAIENIRWAWNAAPTKKRATEEPTEWPS